MLPTKIEQSDIPVMQQASDAAWFSHEIDGELLLDVYQDADNLYVRSTVAGVRPDDLEVSMHDDMLTIRGTRKTDETISRDNYFFQECYWGSFSRSIVLPLDVRTEKVNAVLRDGVLTVTLPKAERRKKISISVTE